MYSFNVGNFDEWRAVARALLRANIAPSEVSWQPLEQHGLFAVSLISDVIAQAHPASSNEVLKIPHDFLTRAKQAACFIDNKEPAKKWSVLYSLLWRIKNDGKKTLLLKSDNEVRRLNSMCGAVSRDQHKMKAFVRFKQVIGNEHYPLENGSPENGVEYYVAWFEPSHAIIESVASFFVRRFTGMNWSILTPQGCAHWDMEQLRMSEGAPRPDIRVDTFEAFWKVYYCSIFNPARLKEQAMMSEMPKKYWKYLPEAACIQNLTRGAAASTQQMLEAPATSSTRVRERSRAVTNFQDQLRAKNRVGPAYLQSADDQD
jgi:probable DNA metabolism protein